MKTRKTGLFAVAIAAHVALVQLGACTDQIVVNDMGDTEGSADTDVDTDTDADADADSDTDTGSDGDADSDTDDDDQCDEEPIGIAPGEAKVMFLVDSSSTMGQANWDAAIEAIDNVVNDPANGEIHFGLHLFPKPGENLVDTCESAKAPTVDVAQETGGDIIAWMNGNSPQNGDAALVAGLKYYLGMNATALHDPRTTNYLVVVSNSEDACFTPRSARQFMGDPAPNMLSAVADDIKDVSKIRTIAIGLGGISDAGRAHLDAIARNGGTPYDEHLFAPDAAALEAALVEIAASVRQCKFLLDSPEALADPAKVNLYADGVKVDRDRTHLNGWDWSNRSQSEVQFWGEICDDIKAGVPVDVTATFGCPTQIDGQPTCQKRDFYLEFPTTAIMLLQNVATSMIGSDKWEPVMRALANTVADDRNNPNLFGLAAFPSNDADNTGICEVATASEVALGGPDSRISIVEWGLTFEPDNPISMPLVQGLQRLVNRPGGIEAEDVTGVVVVITDTGDSCVSMQGESAVEQLEIVTGQLVDYHRVFVFPVGYQNGADDEDQLNAIARAGNTGLNSYLGAGNQQELEAVFGQISSMMTSCVFHVPYGGADADYEKANFYMDGEIVPKRTIGPNGWDWVDNTKKDQATFFGSFCDDLKNHQVTEVAVEFGCDTVTAL